MDYMKREKHLVEVTISITFHPHLSQEKAMNSIEDYKIGRVILNMETDILATTLSGIESIQPIHIVPLNSAPKTVSNSPTPEDQHL
jgi:hypothetical protein